MSKASRTESVLSYALAYAARGWRVMPIKPSGKIPLIDDWPNKATTDEAKLREWFGTTYPFAGIGVATGKLSGVVCVDIDVKRDGENSLALWQAAVGEKLPPTIESQTASGGRHFFYKYPDGVEIRNKANVYPGIDIRGEGGQAVIPPSKGKSGQPYKWVSPPGVEVAELPAAYVAALISDAPIKRVGKPLPPGRKNKLRTKTLQFIATGADEGERNSRLAEAAIELAGAGYDVDEAMDKLWLGASSSRPPIDRKEFEATVLSAYAKPRTPYIHEEDEETGWTPAGGTAPTRPSGETQPKRSGAEKPRPEQTGDVMAQLPRVPKPNQAWPTITNVRIVYGSEDEKTTYALSIGEIEASIREATNDWPRRVSGALFTLADDLPDLPGSGDMRTFSEDQAELFAWLLQRAVVYWPASISKGVRSKKNGDGASSIVSRKEVLEHFKATASPEYKAVEFLPHYPQVPGIFYMPCRLPASNGDCLAEFAARLNPDEPIDRLLIVAAMMTPCWGGPPGKRPAFVFSSAYGRGSGKTSTAERICQVFGGRIGISADKVDWERAKSRMLDAPSLSCRCVVIDNVRGRLAGSELEGMLTAPVIEGKRMYVGQFSRPNLLTYFFTSNTPQLSQDLADRSVVIKIGKQLHASGWEEWVEKFLDDNRAALLADLYAAVAQDDKCAIETENRDRWSMWQSAILSKFGDGNAMAALIKTRRRAVDADSDDAAEIAAAIEAEIAACGWDAETTTVRIGRQRMHDLLIKHHAMDKTMSARTISSRLINLIGPTGRLSRLLRERAHKEGFYRWVYHPAKGRAEDRSLEVTMPESAIER